MHPVDTHDETLTRQEIQTNDLAHARISQLQATLSTDVSLKRDAAVINVAVDPITNEVTHCIYTDTFWRRRANSPG